MIDGKKEKWLLSHGTFGNVSQYDECMEIAWWTRNNNGGDPMGVVFDVTGNDYQHVIEIMYEAVVDYLFNLADCDGLHPFPTYIQINRK